MALVKYNNNSISAITTAGQLASGSMVLIKEQTASSSSTVSFVDGSSDVVLDNTYPIYKFEFINIHPSTAEEFMFQGSTNTGSSYGVTITSTAFQAYHQESGASSSLGYAGSSDLAQSTSFQRLSTATVNANNDDSLAGELFIYAPSSTTFVKHFMARTQSPDINFAYDNYIAGYFNTTSAIDAIQFKMDSGNIDSGTIKLYGIRDS